MKLASLSSRPATAEFHRGILEEHLDEVSFLYGLRARQMLDPDVAWVSLQRVEARIEAHLDALAADDGIGLELCRGRIESDQPGELFAILCVFCRCLDAPSMGSLLRTVDLAKAPCVAAIVAALRCELPAGWNAFVQRAIERRDQRLLPLLADVAGHRRLAAQLELRSALEDPASRSVPVIRAVGRLRITGVEAALDACLHAEDAGVRAAALQTMCRIGASIPWHEFLMQAQTQVWPRIVVGMAAGPWAVQSMSGIAASSQSDGSALLALGLLGDPDALPVLLDRLADVEFAEHAALALHWMTGAALFEKRFVPEPVDEDVLLPAELSAWRERQEAPKRADGTPFGETVDALSIDRELWARWLSKTQGRFQPGVRYRSGRPYEPEALLIDLGAEATDNRLRRYAAAELAIRYGCDVAFEVDMPVQRQRVALREIEAWCSHQSFQPGRWYFAAQLQS